MKIQWQVRVARRFAAIVQFGLRAQYVRRMESRPSGARGSKLYIGGVNNSAVINAG
jgi:hypothetical protein